MDNQASRHVVVVPAYQRAEKLNSRTREILDWPRLSKFIISIDGLRKNVDFSEKQRRDAVIHFAMELAQRDHRVEVFVWDENRGVNFHNLRFIKRLLPLSRGLLIIEDDIGVTNKSLDFLADNCDSMGSKGAAAHVSHSHFNFQPMDFRQTLFPNQWGQAIAPDTAENYVSVMNGAKLSRRAVDFAFKKLYSDMFSVLQIERLTQWWFNHFFFCLRHGNWADAVVQYSVIAAKGHYRVPADSLVVDDSNLFDARALTPRIPVTETPHCVHAVGGFIENQYICSTCEWRHSKIHEAKLRNLFGATKHRRLLTIKDRLGDTR